VPNAPVNGGCGENGFNTEERRNGVLKSSSVPPLLRVIVFLRPSAIYLRRVL
jgi:hypothetical protein